jgi:triosephosphate isomerase
MSPILCIGEKERHHDGSHFQVISHELRASLAGVSRAKAKNIVVAYEPIWAVGSKSNGAMNPEDASEAAIFIKKVLAEIFGSGAKSVRVVYGGSVDYKNASLIAHAPGISGLLVGRDSLSPAHFVKIAEAIK